MPKVEVCLQVLERELADSSEFLLGRQLSLADFFMLPIIHAFGFAPEAQAMYPNFPAICAWRAHGSLADSEAVPRRAAAGSDRARAAVGRLTPPEILSGLTPF